MRLFRWPDRLQVLALAAALFATTGASLWGQEKSVRPGVNKEFDDPDVTKWIERFEREGREIFDKRKEIVAACKVKEASAVADIGAGTGLFTRMFAPQVGPKGRVYAVDISKKFIDHILKNCEEQGIKNVIGVVCTEASAELPPDSIDLAFICDTYHHFEYPAKTMQSVHRALRPGGQVVVVDFVRKEGVSSEWVLNHVRADQETVTKEIEAAGFKLVEDAGFMKQQYLLRFERVEATATANPSGPNWLQLAIGSHADDILHRHFLRAQLLDQVQALIFDKPARAEESRLNVLDGRLLVQRGQRMWLDLARVESETAATLRRLAEAKEPKDRLDLMSELRDYVAEVYYDLRAPYKTLADLQKEHPYRDNPDYLRVPVDSDIFDGRRVLHVSKDRVADALAAYADNGDRVIYPAGTAIICDALADDSSFHEAEVLLKRPDGYWTFLIYDRDGRLTPASVEHKGPRQGQPRMTASFSCSACHRLTRQDLSEGLGGHGLNYLERLSQRFTTWPKQVHLGDEYRERKAYELTELVLRQRDAVFGPYGSLLLSELLHKQKSGTLSESDRRRYERLQPQFRTILPPLEKHATNQ